MSGTEPEFSRFYAMILDATAPEDLETLTPADFEAVLRPSFARLGARAEKPHLVTIWSPDEGLSAPNRVLDIYVDDMPFLLDSVLGLLRSEGIGIRLIAHPILPIDPEGEKWTLLPETVEEAPHYESFLHIHLEPGPDEIAIAGLLEELDRVLTDVRRVVTGWRPMLERLRTLVQDYRKTSTQGRQSELAEALHFLAWLADHNFTFLGMREYRLAGRGDHAALEPVAGSGLGILEDADYRFLRAGRDYVEMTPQHVEFLTHPEPLLVTKANRRARVHRRGHMDYVGAKLYDDKGRLTGELRILGLFTSQSLTQPHVEVPFIRRKIAAVMRRSGHDPKSHAGKALMAALESFPRDELFQISEPDLFEFANEIASLPDRPRLKVLPRVDPFDNFVSVLVYVPRDRYTAARRKEIGDYLARRYDGRISDYYPFFPEGELVRVQFLIGRAGGETPRPDRRQLETDIGEILRSFGERIAEAADDPAAITAWLDAFSAGYQTHNGYREALADIAIFSRLDGEAGLGVRLMPQRGRDGDVTLKFYHAGTPIALSDRVPMLEHFGFHVVDERTHTVTPLGRDPLFLHDMRLRVPKGLAFDPQADGARVEEAVLDVWFLRTESDPYGQLVLAAGLTSAEATIFRAYGHYMRQLGLTFSQRYLAMTLGRHPRVTRFLIRLFRICLDPQFDGDRAAEKAALSAAIDAQLETVAALDEDRIIRLFRNLVAETLRTNFFQTEPDGGPRPALCFKLNSPAIEAMPAPRPKKEIFVYSPRLEGVHLRFGDIARGGIRWSDRQEDFRTEVLGLAKAQQVKNAIIVPVGAKGGFVPRHLPAGMDRNAVLAEGMACYTIFVGALLDVTDTLDGDIVVPPPDTVRGDGDDPYLVVAADKGTAGFSDAANAIAKERGFWLGDAFASGGSAGYDHKRMGITARGAWESVKRHFRQMNRDIQTESFTAVGVGDMSGDVFGNGMLLSRKTRLVAAFDHRDIFVDPTPDAELGFMERKRLFDTPRSSWQDYDSSMISGGGGVYSRKAKAITLTPEIRKALGIAAQTVTPNELIRAILLAEVDLLWFGGIGTYVRAEGETDIEVGDRANDPIRVTGDAVRAKVIGEGANLGVTQRGRIAFAMKGGRINTDAIDNSGGVNSSDLEVNIKIALGAPVRAGEMDVAARNALMAEMTEEVAALCLKNNHLQSLALSLAELRSADDLPDLMILITALERDGGLDRGVEALPDDMALNTRLAGGRGLTRPELAVLLAHAKNALTAELLASPVPDDPYLSTELFRYFPDMLKQHQPAAIENHRLRREVIATVLSNAMINRGGPAFAETLMAATSAGPAEIAEGYAAARDSFEITALNAAIDDLDGRVNGAAQLLLYREVQVLLVAQTLWFLRNVGFADGLGEVIARYRSGVEQVRGLVGRFMPPFVAEAVAGKAAGFVEGGVPRELSRRVAELSVLTLASDIVLVSEKHGAAIAEATEALFGIVSLFGLGRITEQGGRIALADRFDRMALDRAMANLMRAVRELSGDVLETGAGPVAARLATWKNARPDEVARIAATIADLVEGELTVSRLSVVAGLLSDLMRG
ncbi:MAG: NAD-glutamate dehydrogenase [Alphaproteobacteria bacterium]|nr:NAD-glutamate dehydrogenase [Alphaproteobacteria bacterium]